MAPFQIIYYNPLNGTAVAERKDGRQYNVEIINQKVSDVVSVGKKTKSSVLSFKIGEDIMDAVNAIITAETGPFFCYDGYGGEVRELEMSQY